MRRASQLVGCTLHPAYMVPPILLQHLECIAKLSTLSIDIRPFTPLV